MGLILLVLLIALLLGGLGFAVHTLWILALVVLFVWVLGFAFREGWCQWRAKCPLVPLVMAHTITAFGPHTAGYTPFEAQTESRRRFL